MRIIAGTFGGTRLSGLKGADLRPTLDRVRESLFNQLAPEIGGARFLDLFAGTGAVGLEALSRGAEYCVFVEPDGRSRALLESNLKQCRVTADRYEIVPMTAARAISALEAQGETFQLVYVDPPFADDLYAATLEALSRSTLVDPEGIVVVEHFHKAGLQESYDRLSLSKNRRLGDTVLSFYLPGPSSENTS